MAATAQTTNPRTRKIVKYVTWVLSLWAPIQVAVESIEKVNQTLLHINTTLDTPHVVLLVFALAGMSIMTFILYFCLWFVVLAIFVTLCDKLCEACNWDDSWTNAVEEAGYWFGVFVSAVIAVGVPIGLYRDFVDMVGPNDHNDDRGPLWLTGAVGGSVLLYC